MFDEAFKNSRKFVGVPIAILLVVMIALASGGAVLASYLASTAEVKVTVLEPLTFDYAYQDSPWAWDSEDECYKWAPSLYPCENLTAYVYVRNDSGVSLPIHAEATPSAVWAGVDCEVTDLDGNELTLIPPTYSMAVMVTVRVACDTVVPSPELRPTWVVEFSRG